MYIDDSFWEELLSKYHCRLRFDNNKKNAVVNRVDLTSTLQGHVEFYGSYQELMKIGFVTDHLVEKNAILAAKKGVAKSKQDENYIHMDRKGMCWTLLCM